MMYAELKQRVCATCKVLKPLSEYGKDRSKPNGINCYCKACKKAWRSKKRKENPESHKALDFKSDLKKNYGMTWGEYNKMYEDQKGCCACCGIPESNFKRKLHVDHDHTSGQVRGLLCTRCNPGIGYFQDSIEKLEMAIKYLNKFKKAG